MLRALEWDEDPQSSVQIRAATELGELDVIDAIANLKRNRDVDELWRNATPVYAINPHGRATLNRARQVALF